MENTLAEVADQSRDWLAKEKGKFKEATQTFITETEDQQTARLAKFRVAMDAQRMSDLQQQQLQLQTEMKQMLRIRRM